MLDISVIILTYNEEIHIRRCIENVLPIAKDIFLVDSFSTDKTLEIAQSLGAQIFQHKWENNHAKQFNWGIENLPIKTKWVLRLDADEYLTQELIDELEEKLPTLSNDISGIDIPYRRIFMGRYIKRGTGLVTKMSIFRYGKGRSEVRLMDEHIELLEGISVEFHGAEVDHNLNSISWWTSKHNGYAIREAADLLNIEFNLTGNGEFNHEKKISAQALSKRAKKYKYARMPLFWRSFMYFFLRYVVRGGFLEGKEGFLWHFLQGWWYRTLVDAKIFEIKKACGCDKEKIIAYLRCNHNIDCSQE